MEKQQLKHSALIYILAALSLPLCCCAGFGALTSGIAFFVAKKELKKHNENPHLYSNQNSIHTGKIFALVMLIINLLYIVYIVYVIYTVGLDELIRQSDEMMKEFQ